MKCVRSVEGQTEKDKKKKNNNNGEHTKKDDKRKNTTRDSNEKRKKKRKQRKGWKAKMAATHAQGSKNHEKSILGKSKIKLINPNRCDWV